MSVDKLFCIDVTFEMRTKIQLDAFIQAIISHKIKSSFISEMKEGAKGKIAERQRKRERGIKNEHWAAADIASVVNGPLENTHV